MYSNYYLILYKVIIPSNNLISMWLIFYDGNMFRHLELAIVFQMNEIGDKQNEMK